MITAFTIIKNEVDYIGYSIMSILDYVDELVYADGNSTDGTIELIEHIKEKYDKDNKIKLFKNKDCKNLKGDYTRLFNWVLKQCTSDYVMFWHADMVMTNPEMFKNIKEPTIRYFIKMVSFVRGGKKYFKAGRCIRWHTIYKNDYGLHQYGDYGNVHEDFYFRDITGDEHIAYNMNYNLNYKTKDSKLVAHHFCEGKDYDRRLDKMIKSLVHCKWAKDKAIKVAKNHPRVTLKSGKYRGINFEIKPFKGVQADVFKKYAYFKEFKKEN